MSEMYYIFFMRVWLSCTATPTIIDNAVTKGYLTEEEATAIKNTPRDGDI